MSLSRQAWIALLGRRDEPVDGVEDYCTFLGQALANRSVDLQQVRVPWVNQGWLSALRGLWRDAAGWRGRWVLLQYTALSWSRRGFPFGVLAVLGVLRRRGVRCAVVFHEPWGQRGTRWVSRVRGACQDWVIHRLYRGAGKAIFADPLENILWLPKEDVKSVFISIGANIPERSLQPADLPERKGAARTVAVFCLSHMPFVRDELQDIATAVDLPAKAGVKVRVLFVGRGTTEASGEIERAFRDVPVEVSNLGLLDAGKVSDVLVQADAMLCVRGRLFPRRGSAIAGVACGLPILGYGDERSISPLDEAGLMLVPYRDCEALGQALTQVLRDSELRARLRARSRRTQQQYFSWGVIAERLGQALKTEQGNA